MPVTSMRILRISYPKKNIFFALEYIGFVCEIYPQEANELFYKKIIEVGLYKEEIFFEPALAIVYSNCFVGNGLEFCTKHVML